MVSDIGDGTLSEIVTQTYINLPNWLKPCFRYFGNFPEDSEIKVEKLFQLWIAENLISLQNQDGEVTMIDVAKRYLKELEKRFMVQVQVDESTGWDISCCLTDIFRDLCLSMCYREEYLQVIDLQPTREIYSSSTHPNLINRIRKLAVYVDDLKDLDNYVPPKRKVAKHLQSVLFYLQKYNRRSRISHIVQSHLTDFNLVIVLDLGGLVFSKLDESIGKLTCLKYLGLRYTVFHELPSTLENVENLQTLDLWNDNTQYASTSVRNVLWKLKQLRYLYLRNFVWTDERRERLQLAGLTELEILENCDFRVFNVADLSKLNNLRKLGAKINKISDVTEITKYLHSDDSKRLQYLALSVKHCDLYSEEGQDLLKKVFMCQKLYELCLDGRTGKLPTYDKSFSKCLTKVTFESCELKDDPMAILEKFPNIRSLILNWNAFVGMEMACSATGFPELRMLQIWRMRNLQKWKVEEGAMPNLRSLDIVSCPNLKIVPVGLQVIIPTLKKLIVKGMPEAFTKGLPILDGTQGEDDGNEAEYKKADAASQGGVIIREPTSSLSMTTSHINEPPPPYKGKGKGPLIEFYPAESSSKDYDHDDNDYDFEPNEMDCIWQFGFPRATSE